MAMDVRGLMNYNCCLMSLVFLPGKFLLDCLNGMATEFDENGIDCRNVASTQENSQEEIHQNPNRLNP